MADNRPIGLFDSGVGGLSVLREIKKSMPKETFVFLADQKNVPYGGKTKKELNDLTKRITEFLLKFDIKMLVVACNTASCYSINFLRKNFSFPIVGVVPAIKPAVKLTKKRKITIMSTPATAKSAYLKNLVNKFSQSSKVLNLGCYGLEDSVETLSYRRIDKLLDSYVAKSNTFDSDVIILGCTHFPFLKTEIKKRSSRGVKIIDSGKAIAKRVKFLLSERKSLSSSRGHDLYYTTNDPKKFSKVASVLLQQRINSARAQI